MAELYSQTFAALKRVWPWAIAVLAVSLYPLFFGGASLANDIGKLFVLMFAGGGLQALFWIVLGFALHLVVLKPEGENGVGQNLAVLWPYVWRLFVSALIYLIGMVPVLFIGFPIVAGMMPSEISAGSGIAPLLALNLVAVLVGGLISVFVGTWLPAAIFGRLTTLSNAFERGGEYFRMTVSLLLKGPFVLAILAYGLSFALGLAWSGSANAALPGLVIFLVDTLAAIVLYAMTTVIFCKVYQHALTEFGVLRAG